MAFWQYPPQRKYSLISFTYWQDSPDDCSRKDIATPSASLQIQPHIYRRIHGAVIITLHLIKPILPVQIKRALQKGQRIQKHTGIPNCLCVRNHLLHEPPANGFSLKLRFYIKALHLTPVFIQFPKANTA